MPRSSQTSPPGSDGVINSYWLRRYVLDYPIVRPLAMLLKEWASVWELNSGMKGRLNSYALDRAPSCFFLGARRQALLSISEWVVQCSPLFLHVMSFCLPSKEEMTSSVANDAIFDNRPKISINLYCF